MSDDDGGDIVSRYDRLDRPDEATASAVRVARMHAEADAADRLTAALHALADARTVGNLSRPARRLRVVGVDNDGNNWGGAA